MKKIKDLKIVAIGGGTGLSNLLRVLKTFTSNITAVVAVTDDGGSSGKLRQDFGILPPGDVRACLVALSSAEDKMANALSYRFPEDSTLGGHNLGNLLMAGIMQAENVDVAEATGILSEVLAIEGKVLPSTVDFVEISSVMEDGLVVTGETSIVADKRNIREVFLTPANCKPLPAVLDAIAEADYIFIGPGSLYTSLISSLLVPEIVPAICASDAEACYICNLTTQCGETEKDLASQYVNIIENHCEICNMVDKVIANNGEYSQEQLAKMAEVHVKPVVCDLERLEKFGLEVLTTNLIDENDLWRHHSENFKALLEAEFKRKCEAMKLQNAKIGVVEIGTIEVGNIKDEVDDLVTDTVVKHEVETVKYKDEVGTMEMEGVK